MLFPVIGGYGNDIINGGDQMTILEALIKVKDLGYPIALIAKNLNRDPSTLQKWTTGKSNLSLDLQQEVAKEIRRLKNEWLKIEI